MSVRFPADQITFCPFCGLRPLTHLGSSQMACNACRRTFCVVAMQNKFQPLRAFGNFLDDSVVLTESTVMRGEHRATAPREGGRWRRKADGTAP